MSSQNTGACSVALCKEKAVVVVVVDYYTYYWVYLSSEHPFQVCYTSLRQVLLQSAMAFYYKVSRLVYYNVRQILLQSATILLQIATGITR